MKYFSGCAISVEELLYNAKSYCGKSNYKIERYHSCNYLYFIALIFSHAIRIIVENIIEDNSTFWFPLTGIAKACFKVDRIANGEFIYRRKKGLWKDLDVIASGFTGPNIQIHVFTKVREKIKTLTCSARIMDRMVLKCNEGFQYGDSLNDKYLSDYIDLIYDFFKNIDKLFIIKVLKFGFRRMYMDVARGADINIKTKPSKKHNAEQFNCYIGNLPCHGVYTLQEYAIRLSLKLKIMFSIKKFKWNGHAYFILNEEQNEEYLKTRTVKNIKLYKLFDICNLSYIGAGYIYEVKHPDFRKNHLWYNELTGDFRLVLHRESLKFKDMSICNHYYYILNNKVNNEEEDID